MVALMTVSRVGWILESFAGDHDRFGLVQHGSYAQVKPFSAGYIVHCSIHCALQHSEPCFSVATHRGCFLSNLGCPPGRPLTRSPPCPLQSRTTTSCWHWPSQPPQPVRGPLGGRCLWSFPLSF